MTQLNVCKGDNFFMLIINTESPTLGKSKMVYLFINGKHIDNLKTSQVKSYKLDPGKYQVAMRLNFYRTDLIEVAIKPGSQVAYELTLKNNWTFFFMIIASFLVAVTADYFIREAFGNLWANIFFVLFFVGLYVLKVKTNKNGYLELKEIKLK